MFAAYAYAYAVRKSGGAADAAAVDDEAVRGCENHSLLQALALR